MTDNLFIETFKCFADNIKDYSSRMGFTLLCKRCENEQKDKLCEKIQKILELYFEDK